MFDSSHELMVFLLLQSLNEPLTKQLIKCVHLRNLRHANLRINWLALSIDILLENMRLCLRVLLKKVPFDTLIRSLFSDVFGLYICQSDRA
jgi:hypothetical protein